MPTIVLSSPSALVASLPYLVGFTPADSVVLIWLKAGEILLTQRADMPARARREWLQALWHHPASGEADGVVIVAVSQGIGAEQVVRAVMGHAAQTSVPIRDALVTDGASWRSLMCGDLDCSCLTPQEVPESISIAVAAEFAYLGMAPKPSRAALMDEISACADPAVDAMMGRRGIVRPRTPRAVEAWRDRTLVRVMSALAREARDVAPADVALVICGVQDVRVRDVLLWHMSQWEEERLRRAWGHLQHATRCAPASQVAAVATVGAISAWLLGDGARAGLSLERGREADPEYSLGRLVSMALASGLPPSCWREATSALRESVCRYGDGATRQ